jgi:hypothetical protein
MQQVRLNTDHTHEGLEYKAFSVITVDDIDAEWMERQDPPIATVLAKPPLKPLKEDK